MKITKQQVVDLSNALHEVGDLSGVKFSYAVAKNLYKIKPIIEELKENFQPLPEYAQYQNERIALAEKNAVQLDGKPQKRTENGVERFILRDEKKFAKEMEVLQKKYKNCISQREAQESEFKKSLEGEVEIDFHMVSMEDIPGNITPQQMSGILSIVTDKTKIDTYTLSGKLTN